jgi:hypothetical protein
MPKILMKVGAQGDEGIVWHTAELVGAEVQQLQAAGRGCRRQSLQVHHMVQLFECKVLVAGQPCISANHHISTLLHQPVI